ncbi:MAG: TonB-dependent receptor, partial [Vicinamibacterales bacterium]
MWIVAALLLLAPPAHARIPRGTAAGVTGHVTDNAGQPIRNASVSIVELGLAVTTGADGAYAFRNVPAGRFHLTARRVGYVAAAREITVSEAGLTADFSLGAGTPRLEPVNITATREPVAAADNPIPTSTLGNEQLRRDAGISLAHSLARLPGVRSVSSGEQIGKPMIRGLFGPRILVLSNGSRLEDYSWSDEDGPSIDARMAQRVEVIRGPASVLYGSEAMGGVVNVAPIEVPFSADGARLRRAGLEVYGATNNIELGSAAMLEGAQGKYGYSLIGTGRFANNYNTPTGKVGNSGFFAVNGEGAFGVLNAHGSTVIRAANYGGEFHLLESTGPEPGDPNGGPVRQTLDDRIQVTNEYLTGGIRFETKAQWQRHGLKEVSDDCVPPPGQTTCTKVKDQVAFALTLNTGTLDLLAHHALGEHVAGTAGVSGMYQSSTTGGPIYLVPSATVNSGAVFLFERGTFGPLSIIAGARGDSRHLSSEATPQLSLAADSRSWSQASADAGFVLHAIPSVSITGNIGAGWRAPTLFDLYTNGPNLGDARYEIGDPTLRSERATDVDGGLRWSNGALHAEASVFRNDINDYIYVTPTGTTQNGLPVFRHVQADARLTGGEVSAEARVAEPLLLRASYELVNGTDRRTDTPLPLISPPRTLLGGELGLGAFGLPKSAHLGAELEIVNAQTRLSAFDYGTKGYTLLNLDFSTERIVHRQPLRIDLRVRNATNASYK